MNDSAFQIQNTERQDLELIFKLFDSSVSYQEKNGYPAWSNYDKNVIIQDIDNKNQYKVVIQNAMTIVFSVCYSDIVIWRTMDQNDSVYLHRIVVNPESKGKKLFSLVLEWAVRHAKQMNRHTVRMDTWASNSKLIKYYESFGFSFIENYTTPDSPELPVHNRNLPVALLELKVK